MEYVGIELAAERHCDARATQDHYKMTTRKLHENSCSQYLKGARDEKKPDTVVPEET